MAQDLDVGEVAPAVVLGTTGVFYRDRQGREQDCRSAPFPAAAVPPHQLVQNQVLCPARQVVEG